MIEALRYPYSKPGRRLARFLYGMNKRGQKCPISKEPCQTDYCCHCPTWQALVRMSQSLIMWQVRYLEWKALFDYCCENRLELEAKDRIRAMVFCLQRHWQDMRRLQNTGYTRAKTKGKGVGG